MSRVVIALFAIALAAGPAHAQRQADQVTREEIEVAAAGIDIPEGVDRQCVIDHAIEAAPNVGVNLVGLNTLSAEQQQRANELGRRVRAGDAVQAGITACTPQPEQTDTVTNAQP